MASARQKSPMGFNYDAREGKRSHHLLSTIERLARAGERAGFSVEEMIEMLNAGVSIGALLDMISYSLSHNSRLKCLCPEVLQCRERSALDDRTSGSPETKEMQGTPLKM